MKKSFSWKKIAPHGIVVSVFLGIVIVFFAPIFFEGKKLFHGDIPYHEGIKKELIDYRAKTGKEPLWSRAVFSGMPAYLLDIQYDEPLNKLLGMVLSGGISASVGLIMAALLGSYCLLLVLGVHPYIALSGGLAYGLSTFTLISTAIGHDGKVAAMAYIPFVLAGIHIAYYHYRWLGALLTAVGLSLEIAATHPQVTYYLALLVLCYGANQLWLAIRNKTLRPFVKTSGALVLAAVVAMGANWGRLWSLYEYTASSIRHNNPTDLTSTGIDESYVFKWSLGKAETMTLLIPYSYGGSNFEQLGYDTAIGQAFINNGFKKEQVEGFLQAVPTYWGDQPFVEAPLYLGIVVCFFFLVSLWVIKPGHRYWLLTGTVLAILLCWGKNFAWFNSWLYHHFPGYNKFRAVTTAIVMTQVTTVVGACLGLNHLLAKGFSVPFRRGLAWVGGSLAVLLVAIRLAAEQLDYACLSDDNLPVWVSAALRLDRKMLLIYDTNRACFLLILVGLLLLSYGKKIINKDLFCWVLALLIGGDAYAVGKRYVRDMHYHYPAHIASIDAPFVQPAITADTTLGFRILDTNHPFTNGRTCYYYRSVGGYHGAKLHRYQQLITHGLSNEWKQIQQAFLDARQLPDKTPLLNMLNTRYFMTADGYNDTLYYNPAAQGAAWFVQSLHIVPDAHQALAALGQVDLRQVAVFDQADLSRPFPAIDGQTGTIQLQVEEPNHLQYTAEIAGNGLAVFSEIFYQPGWYAWIDDQPVIPLRANYLLRALPIPAGKHTITFKFQPSCYIIGKQLMWIFQCILLVLLLLASGYVGRVSCNANQLVTWLKRCSKGNTIP